MPAVLPLANSEMHPTDAKEQAIGSFMLVLHAHLPHVLTHGRWPNGVDWLCEATAETYVPLLNVFNRLEHDGITARASIALTPILCEMLADMSFIYVFEEYLQFRIDAASRNAREFAAQGLDNYRDTALFWENWYTNIARDYEQTYERDIVGAFRKLQDSGSLEIMTSAATHAYLPLLSTDAAIQAQISVGVASYKRHFGRPPRGIWLPECAYRPRGEWAPPALIIGDDAPPPPVLRGGIEEFLAANELSYFIIDEHLLRGGKAPDIYKERFESLHCLEQPKQEQPIAAVDATRSPYATYLVSSVPQQAGTVACFTRHDAISGHLESASQGYAADGYYLDAQKKHFPGGHRLWRVTAPEANLAQKQPYEPLRVREICEAQANHFVELIKGSLQDYHHEAGQAGVVCCAVDTKLFGPLWFEGSNWLYRALKKLAQDEAIRLTMGGLHLDAAPPATTISLPEGSWGEGGDHLIWLNRETAWTWREVYACEAMMSRLARDYIETPNPKLQQILQQCAREVLLMEASDWPFLISTVVARDYAAMRCAGHVNVFQRLVEIIEKVAAGAFMTEGERQFLHAIQARDNGFPKIAVELWAEAR